MLSAKVRLLFNRTLTVIVAVLTMGGSLSQIAAVPAVSTSATPRLLATWKIKLEGSSSGGGAVEAPTGLVVCLDDTASMNFDGAVPYPDYITDPAVVGCDTLLTPGTTQTLTYNAENDPKFDAFAALFTNSTDDFLWVYAAQVDDNLMPAGIGGGNGGCESLFGKRKAFRSCSIKNLPVGYTIDFIRVTASNIVSTATGDASYHTYAYSVDMLWEAYGHK